MPSAVIRFGPAIKALLLCLLIAGPALGYVWQKNEIGRLGKQIADTEVRLAQLRHHNQTLEVDLQKLCLPGELEQRARSMGLVPQQSGQVVRLADVAAEGPENRPPPARLAGRPAGDGVR